MHDHYYVVSSKPIPFQSEDWSSIYSITMCIYDFFLAVDRCKRVIEIARKYDILIFCDDVYNLLTYTPGPPPARLLTYDKP